MHARRQVLLLGDSLQQQAQLVALLVGERGGDRELVLAGDPVEARKRSAAAVGQRYGVVAAIVRIAFAPDEAPLLELVYQGDQARGVHPERVGEVTLALAGYLGEAAENAGLWRRKPQRPDALGECGGGAGSDLCEQEGDATVPWWALVAGGRRSHLPYRVQTEHNKYRS
jgi:hypothetical protein